MNLKNYVLSLCLLFSIETISQVNAPITRTIPTIVIDNLVQGRLYSPNYFPIRGNPFLIEDWSMGSIRLLDKDYLDVPLWYDIYADDLILLYQQPESFQFIRLSKKHIQHFEIEDRSFINLEYSKYKNVGLENRFYELVFEDKISLLAERKVEVITEDKDLISSFTNKDEWFLIKDNEAHRIRNKKSFLATLEEKALRKQVASFIKKERIVLLKAGSNEWLQVVSYLNTLY